MLYQKVLICFGIAFWKFWNFQTPDRKFLEYFFSELRHFLIRVRKKNFFWAQNFLLGTLKIAFWGLVFISFGIPKAPAKFSSLGLEISALRHFGVSEKKCSFAFWVGNSLSVERKFLAERKNHFDLV